MVKPPSFPFLFPPFLSPSSHSAFRFIEIDKVTGVNEGSTSQLDRTVGTFQVHCDGRVYGLRAHSNAEMNMLVHSMHIPVPVYLCQPQCTYMLAPMYLCLPQCTYPSPNVHICLPQCSYACPNVPMPAPMYTYACPNVAMPAPMYLSQPQCTYMLAPM